MARTTFYRWAGELKEEFITLRATHRDRLKAELFAAFGDALRKMADDFNRQEVAV